MLPKLPAATLIAAIVLSPAHAALAHGGNGGSTSDYRIEVTGFEGDPSGIEVRPVELGNRMELVRTSALACAGLGALVLLPALRRLIPALAIVAGVAAVVGSGPSGFRVVAGLVAVAAAIAGWLLHSRWLSAGAALVAAFFAVTHLEVFEHQLLAGWAPAALQRIAVSVALAFGLAVVGREVVGELGATQPEPGPAMAEA
ncbi:MAG TPA: hypothetical protein VLD86_15055 [Ilumatobacteraceae bacterium]|nr:hypothetical protein [Ilumatobacteraceae bacterium]